MLDVQKIQDEFVEDVKALSVKDYLDEKFKTLFSVEESGYGYVKLITPFTLPDGTVIVCFLKLNKDGEVEHITDLGCTLGWVYLQIPGEINDEFWEKVKDVEVDLIGEMLITKPSPNLILMQSVFKLITAIIRVSNLSYCS